MNAILCPNCHSPNRPGSHFCVRCGGAITAADASACPRCGVPVRSGAGFCAACGFALRSVAAQPGQHPAPPILVARWPDKQQEEHPLHPGVLTIGRAPNNDIVLNFPTISKQHLRLEVAADGITLTDLGSTNGTMHNGRTIPSQTPHPWNPGDVIRIGDLQGNSISLILRAPSGEFVRTRPLGMHKLAQLPQVTLGRDPASAIVLDHPSVSRRHAEIVRQGGQALLRDLGSANGVFVNGQRVTGETPLGAGDVIQIGPYKLVYDLHTQGLSTSMSRGHRLDTLGLGKQVAGGRMILEDVSLSVQAGEFIALVGGSGAGKSTLLKAMNGFNPATHGQMLVDGENLYANLGAYRTLMGYVPQDDIIHRELPVRQALWYAAKLRLPDASAAEIEARIKDVLEMVELTAHAAKPVRVLSGGQRKRVSIAVELLAQPDLLFLDEPTSGLDPGLEKKMMYDLNRLADQGRTVVLVTHATANIEQCDHVTFLVHGHLAYYGPPREAIGFFQARDFADIYLKLSEEVNPAAGKPAPAELQPYVAPVQARLAGDGGSARVPAGLLWAEHYQHSPLFQTYVTARQANLGQAHPGAPGAQSAPKKARDSALRQTAILARRQLDLIRNDLRTLFILLLMMPLIGLLFMLVSDKQALVGWELPRAQIETRLKLMLLTGMDEDAASELSPMEADRALERAIADRLDATPVKTSETYNPQPTAQQLVLMIGLALTQAGTFGASYEIVKERGIFKRERSVNLKVSAYVISKVLVLGLFAIIQVTSVLLILALKMDLGVAPIFELFPFGALELFVTLLLAVLASIMLGLFISAVVPSADVVLYIILIQLFVQIVLSGVMFPLPDNPASKLAVSNWTMDALGATVDMHKLNEEALVCTVVELPRADGTGLQKGFNCDSASRPKSKLGLSWAHTETHLLTAWGALLAQAVFWAGATTLVQARKKGD